MKIYLTLNGYPSMSPTKRCKLVYMLGLFAICYVIYKYYQSQDPHHFVPRNLHKYLRVSVEYERPLAEAERNMLRVKLENINARKETSNWRSYGPVLAQTPTLVVQVGGERGAERRVRYLVAALAQVHGIHSALLVVSHARYRPPLHRLLDSIDYCKVVQIYYPHSVQLYPDRFPGPYPDEYESDEATNMYKSVPVVFKRNATLTEQKQHWWWTAKFVFNEMEWSSIHKALVMFLQDDDYVSPDVLRVLSYAERALSYFISAEVISLGGIYSDSMAYDVLTVDSWRPVFGRGLAFNKTTWKNILYLEGLFCMYDDYRWSYSLWNLFTMFPKGHAEMVAAVAPRVFSTSGFGSSTVGAEKIWRRFTKAKLYPSSMKVACVYGLEGKVARPQKVPRQGSGGWRDLRDQLLCLGSTFDVTAHTSKTAELFANNNTYHKLLYLPST